MSEQLKQEIIKKLIEMRKAGKFYAIYCDADRLRLQRKFEGPRFPISWREAGQLVGIAVEYPRAYKRVVYKHVPPKADYSGWIGSRAERLLETGRVEV